ncbi:MAG TPA: twin-arginine translocase subunit TatC, partial [Candidatus Baltobacteraceae bacterium]|nr:twin-arginine translocase subunit TatC [Candidatus Baltobacteraceae bacterium]
MADHEQEHSDAPEGGPVKTFLEHLEDFRWVLVKSIVALAVAMLVCLIAANNVIQIIKWPLTRTSVSYPGTNQIAIVNFGTNHVGNFQLSSVQQKSLNPGTTNRFVVVQIEPLTVGTNQILGWHVSDNPQAIANAQKLHVELINLHPAGGFFVAFQIALYGGMVL